MRLDEGKVGRTRERRVDLGNRLTSIRAGGRERQSEARVAKHEADMEAECRAMMANREEMHDKLLAFELGEENRGVTQKKKEKGKVANNRFEWTIEQEEHVKQKQKRCLEHPGSRLKTGGLQTILQPLISWSNCRRL